MSNIKRNANHFANALITRMRSTRFAGMAASGLILATSVHAAAPANAQHFEVIAKAPVKEVTGWDSLAFDPHARRLFITANSGVVVVDVERLKVVGKIATNPKAIRGAVHAVAISQTLGMGFNSVEDPSSVIAFDLKGLQTRYKVPVDKGADEIVLDTQTDRLFTLNAKDKSVHDISVVEAQSGRLLTNIPLPAKPEAGIADNRGNVYVTLPGLDKVAIVDASSMTVKDFVAIDGCNGPHAITMDKASQVLFIACKKSRVIAYDITKRQSIGSVTSGSGTDAIAFDSKRGLVFASNGEGTLTIAAFSQAEGLQPVQTLATGPGARTMALDEEGQRVFLLSAVVAERTTPTAQNPHGYGGIKSGTVNLLVVGPSPR